MSKCKICNETLGNRPSVNIGGNLCCLYCYNRVPSFEKLISEFNEKARSNKPNYGYSYVFRWD